MAEYYYSSKDILDRAIGTDAYFQIKSILTSTKAADVAPVRKGRWETIGLSSLKCSKCGYLDDLKMYHRYCPDCGCFMR